MPNLPWPGPGPIIRPLPQPRADPNPIQGQDNALIQLVRRPLRAIFSRSKLYPPDLTQAAPPPTFVALPVRTSLADTRRPQAVQSELRPPVIDSVVVVTFVAPPIRTKLAAQRRPQIVQSEVRPPVFFAAVVSFVASSVRVTLARARRTQAVQSELRAPSVVAPGIVFTPVQRTLVQSPRQNRAPHSKLRPPSVVAPAVVFDPVRRTVTRAQRPRPAFYRLRPPVSVPVISIIPGVVAALISLTRRNLFGGRYATHSELRPPTVIDPFVPPTPPTPVVTRSEFVDSGLKYERDSGEWNYDRRQW